MSEKNLVINHRTVSHHGIFRVDELFKTINAALKHLNYQKTEKKSEETVFPTGKKTSIELRPFKDKTNYVTLMIKIKVDMERITETTKTINNVKRKFQEGDVTIVFDAWSITDYQSRWGMKPFFYFLKAAINKYIYHFPSEENFVNELKFDTTYLSDQVKALFGLYKYKAKE